MPRIVADALCRLRQLWGQVNEETMKDQSALFLIEVKGFDIGTLGFVPSFFVR